MTMMTAEKQKAFWDKMDVSAMVKAARAKAPWQVEFADELGGRRVACFYDRRRAIDFHARADLNNLRPVWVRRG